jgi:hypothetical protein
MPTIDYTSTITRSYVDETFGVPLGTEVPPFHVPLIGRQEQGLLYVPVRQADVTHSGKITASLSLLSAQGTGAPEGGLPPRRQRMLSRGAGRGQPDLARRSEEILANELGRQG